MYAFAAMLLSCHQIHAYPSLYLDVDPTDSGTYIYQKTTPPQKFRAAVAKTFKARYLPYGGGTIKVLSDDEIIIPVFDEGMYKDMVFRKTPQNTWKKDRLMTY